MALPFGEFAFAFGEIAPSLWGRVDIAHFHVAAATLRNCYVGIRGGAYSRAGTAYVGMSKQSPLNGQYPPRLIDFNFSLSQEYVCEFGDGYVRFISDGGYVVEASFAITGATQANPCVIHAAGHDFNNGDWVVIGGVDGMTQLNGSTYIVANSNQGAGTFSLETTDSGAVNSTGYGAYTGGGSVARIYTIPSPYSGTDLAQLKWTQSADVLTIAHPNYPPYNLSRFGSLNWSMSPVAIAPTIAAPAGISVVANVLPNPSSSPPTLPAAYAYVVTAVNAMTGEESAPSPVGNVTNGVDMAATNGSNTINWTPVTGAAYYNIYRAPTSYNTDPGNTSDALPVPVGALFGLTAQAFGTEFVDNNSTPDYAQSPPQFQNPLAPGQVLSVPVTASSNDWTMATVSITSATGSGFVGEVIITGGSAPGQIVAVLVINAGTGYLSTDTPVFTGDGTSASATVNAGPTTGTYPSLVAYFQQRRVYAASLNNPDTYWMSQPGSFNNFDTSIPVNDSDAVTGSPWSEQVNGIQFMIEMPLGLLAFTGSSIETVQASGASVFSPEAITPSNQQALPQSSIGSSATLMPVRDNWDLLYFEADNATLRDLTYQLYFNLYTGIDVTWQSSHLTFGYQVVDRAWCRKPNYLLWCVRQDGILLSFTFMKDQQVTGWAKHTTQGQFRSICSIFESPVDALYCCVERPVAAGGTRFFIERMDNRIWRSAEDPWCLDLGTSPTLREPAASLSASAATGNGVVFIAGSGVFSAGDVGQTIRSGGGIALVTAYTDAQHVTGNWVYPCQQILPDDPLNRPLAQTAGNWSIGPQLTSVQLPYQMALAQVVGLADGVPIGPLDANANGTVTLPFPASDVKIGLAFTAQVQSVYLSTGDQPTDQGRRKSVNALTIRCEASSPMTGGVNEIDVSAQSPPPLAVVWTTGLGGLPASPQQLPATYTNPGGQTVQPPFTGDLRLVLPSGWAKPAQVAAQQMLPLPMNILAFVPEIQSGDEPEDRLQPQQGRPPPLPSFPPLARGR